MQVNQILFTFNFPCNFGVPNLFLPFANAQAAL